MEIIPKDLDIVVDFGEHVECAFHDSSSWPIIDQSFIDDYCNNQKLSFKELIFTIRKYCINYYVNNYYSIRTYFDYLEKKGHSLVCFEMAIIAIQIYATTKREKDQIITEKNYRDRLAQVLDCDVQDIANWFVRFQENTWLTLYQILECGDIDPSPIECATKTGIGRYVQYPLKYAERIFTTEDLKYIAGCFVWKELYSGEVASMTDFKRIISENYIKSYCLTNHSKTVLSLASDAYQQVFSFYLRWKGEYKDYCGRDKQIKEQFNLYIKISDGHYWLELRDSSLNLQERFDIKSITYDKLRAKNYRSKRNNTILFQPYEDGYWQEVRYIENKEQVGFLLSFSRQSIHGEIVLQTPYVTLYQITYNINNKEYFSEQVLPYRFVGGLKVNFMTYLQGKGGAPILRLTSQIPVKIDGKKPDNAVGKDIFLDGLTAGCYTISIRGYRDIRISFKEPVPCPKVWMNDSNRWYIDKHDKWESQNPKDCEDPQIGVVGLDFSAIPQKSQGNNEPILTRWSRMLASNPNSSNESNITLQILKNTEL